MKKVIQIFKISFLAVFLLMMISCDSDSSVQYGSLSVNVSDSEDNRTIKPDSKEIDISYYRIYGTHRTLKDTTVEEMFRTDYLSLDGLAVGEWNFTVYGYNNNGVLLAQSYTETVDIEVNEVSYFTYYLNWLEGEGTLSLSIVSQSSKVAEIECNLTEVNSSKVVSTLSLASPTLNGSEYVFEGSVSLENGYYDAEITIKDKDGNKIGTTLHPSVHIYTGLTSSYEIPWSTFSKFVCVDSPVASISSGETIPCTSVISLSSEESDVDFYYSFDGLSYSKCDGSINLENEAIDDDDITLYVYAAKKNRRQSSIATYKYNVEHTKDEPTYAWDGDCNGVFTCRGKEVCKYHSCKIFVDETVTATSSINKESTCIEEGEGSFSVSFVSSELSAQTATLAIPMKPHVFTNEVAADNCSLGLKTCIEGIYYRSCVTCGLSSNSSSNTFTTTPLGHNYVEYKCSRCPLWTTGPSGGYVFYDCDADNSEENDGAGPDGLKSSVCGWRFLEAAPKDLSDKYIFGFIFNSIASDILITVGTDSDIGDGKTNTDKIVEKDGRVSDYSKGFVTASEYAAKACYEFECEGYDDWFLPSSDELWKMYINLKKNKLGVWKTDDEYWSSTESGKENALYMDFEEGIMSYKNGDRSNEKYVRPIRSFL